MRHDYREDIVKRKRDKEYWGNWSNWNILYKTLAYETSSSKDVERYSYVRNEILEYYDVKISDYVGKNYSFDIMNGWWYCFKELFCLDSRKSSETKAFMERMKQEIYKINRKDALVEYLVENYCLKKETAGCLIEYLEVVYTIGNIVPVPKGANRHADNLDSWEYKINSSFLKYQGSDYNDYFHFNEYTNMIFKIDKENKEDSIFQYMNTRISLIKNRGEFYRIKGNKDNR